MAVDFLNIQFAIRHKKKLRGLFQFTGQLLYSRVSVSCVTVACDVNHANVVNRERPGPIPQY
jgi:hypothetical protein